ncbi:MAG: FtsX-like permease family protein [Candidatus Krumholzibacteriota bacterium]|nr:FtsX-like permease family protein [Candidatus Krumholzibacteriota bacterium]
MHYSISIAMRYLRTRRRAGLVSRVTMIAVGGTFVGVTALVIVLSLMNGFETELRSRIIGFNTHVLLFAHTPSAWEGIDSVAAIVDSIPEVLGTAPFVRGEALTYYELIPGVRVKTLGVIVKGIDLERERFVSTVVDSITPPITTFRTSGFDDGDDLPGIVLGRDLADALRIAIGEKMSLVTAPARLVLGKVKPRTKEFRVAGYFRTGVYEFDSRFAYVGLGEAEALFDFEGASHGLGVKIEDIYRAADVDEAIRGRLAVWEYGTNNWINQNRNLFSYIKVEKILMFLLLALIILIAAFNLVGMLTMVIMEKRSEIGILRSMGASSGGIMSIFMFEGTLIGSLGTGAGVAAGLAICALLDKIELGLPPDVYFINTLPVVVQPLDVLLIAAASLAISFLATVYPSWEACRVTPLDAIRYD